MIGIHRAVTAVALCGFQIGLTAQHPPQHTAPRGNSASVLIDGSKEPLLVPDELAFKLLLVTLSAAGTLLAVRDINRSIDSLVTRTLTEATGTLSATGRALLTEHLAYIKTRTRIYASPKM